MRRWTDRDGLSKDMIITFGENNIKDYYQAWEKLVLCLEPFAAYLGSNTLGSMRNRLTHDMSMYTESFHLLSDCQKGFRKHRNIMRALQSFLIVL